MQHLKNRASRVFAGKGKGDEKPEAFVKPNAYTIDGRATNPSVAPWEAQKPPPPVPQIPAKYLVPGSRRYIPISTPYSEKSGLPKSPSKVTFATSSKSSHHKSKSVSSPPSDPKPSPFTHKKRGTSFSFSSHRRSGSTASVHRLKPTKSPKDILKTISPFHSPDIAYISRPVLVPQPRPDSRVPRRSATVKFTKPRGPQPQRPQRPYEQEDWGMEVMRRTGITRTAFEGDGRKMGMISRKGKACEMYSPEKYTVRRARGGMVTRDIETGVMRFVADM